MKTKSCPTCGETKPLEEFYKNRSARDGRTGYCKPCDRARSKKWQEANPETYAQVRRSSALKSLYGITQAEFDALLSQQSGMCAICGTTEPGHRGVFAVDHCHWTNKVRGLLCVNCNRGIGWLKDNPALLREAANYLEIRN